MVTRIIDEIRQFKLDVDKGGMLLIDYAITKKVIRNRIKEKKQMKLNELKLLYRYKKITSDQYIDTKLMIEEVANKYYSVLADC